jgi:hypothetical protein
VLGVTVSLTALKYGLQQDTLHQSLFVAMPDGTAEALMATSVFGGVVSIAGAIAVGDAIRH